MNPKPRTQRIREVDGLRAISIVMVVLFHMVAWGQVAGRLDPTLADHFGFLGALGVDMFFVMSGFLITKLMIDENEAKGSVSLVKFFLRRIFRILPAYWFYIFVVLLLGTFHVINLSNSSFLWDFVFLSNIFQDHNWFTTHSWSLSTEEQFYFLFPIIMWKVVRGNLRFYGLILAVLFCFTSASVKISNLLHHDAFGHINVDLSWLFSFRSIIIGVLIAVSWPSVSRIVGQRGIWFPIVSLAWLLVGGFSVGGLDFGYAFFIYEPVVLALIFTWVVTNPAYCGILRWGPIQWLGGCSYSIFLWQQLFTAVDSRYLMVRLSPAWIAIPSLLIISALSYYLIERSYMAVGRKLTAAYDEHRARAATPAPLEVRAES